LAQSKFKQQHGDPQEEETQQVRNEERRSTPLVAKVRETPQVSKANSAADRRENKRGV